MATDQPAGHSIPETRLTRRVRFFWLKDVKGIGFAEGSRVQRAFLWVRGEGLWFWCGMEQGSTKRIAGDA